MSEPNRPGILRRTWRILSSPSARWSVLALAGLGLVVGAGAVIGTQVSLHLSGTDEFCGTTCHSHEKFVYAEHKQSVHYANKLGVRAMCVDCHVPHAYPDKLIYKARVGLADAYAELRGTIATQDKFDKARWRLANLVWDEMRANNSANCRSCHDPQAWDLKKQSEDARGQHRKFLSGKATCIDCHTGVAHKEPEEPAEAAKAAAASPSK
jgi:cytochrome c-type protein NapC